ncbi:Exportin-4, partial [Dissophora globulifera]
IPRVCTLYIRLISRLVGSYPGRLVELPNDLLNNLMASLKFGIDHNILEVSHLTFEAITSLALYACNAPSTATEALRPHLDEFLKLTFEQLLFKKLDMELVDVAGSCVLALVCARQEAYGRLIQEMLAASETPLTPELNQRLANSFQHLSEAFPSTTGTRVEGGPREMTSRDVAMTVARRDVFMRFLMGVRGVLRVK